MVAGIEDKLKPTLIIDVERNSHCRKVLQFLELILVGDKRPACHYKHG
jgi:hypothetical protein